MGPTSLAPSHAPSGRWVCTSIRWVRAIASWIRVTSTAGGAAALVSMVMADFYPGSPSALSNVVITGRAGMYAFVALGAPRRPFWKCSPRDESWVNLGTSGVGTRDFVGALGASRGA